MNSKNPLLPYALFYLASQSVAAAECEFSVTEDYHSPITPADVVPILPPPYQRPTPPVPGTIPPGPQAKWKQQLKPDLHAQVIVEQNQFLGVRSEMQRSGIDFEKAKARYHVEIDFMKTTDSEKKSQTLRTSSFELPFSASFEARATTHANVRINILTVTVTCHE